jgi:capsular polysaccharide export protein
VVSWYKARGYIQDFFLEPRWTLCLLESMEPYVRRKRRLDRQFFSVGQIAPDDDRPVAIVFGLRPFRAYQVVSYLPDYRCYFATKAMPPKLIAEHCDLLDNKVTFFIWAYRERAGIAELAASRNIRVVRMEDGFILSKSLGAREDPSLSLLFDEGGLHFDATARTDLEGLLHDFDFSARPELFIEAQHCIELMVAKRISKYNHLPYVDARKIYGPKDRKRVLVIGQSERDASIRYGSPTIKLNNDLVRLARRENPRAEIFYKIHPDVLSKHVTKESDPEEVRDICRVLDIPISIPDALETIDQVYVMTSLSGFEALLRGIPVTVTGTPFYAGWGLTDDRCPLPERRRRLTIEELFAIAFLEYPVYRDPRTHEKTHLGATLQTLLQG